jgi:hypothetical protein
MATEPDELIQHARELIVQSQQLEQLVANMKNW